MVKIWLINDDKTIINSSYFNSLYNSKKLKSKNDKTFSPTNLLKRDVIDRKPYRIFTGHKADIISIEWSQSPTSCYILSSALDSQVLLWNVKKSELTGVFHHSNIVTNAVFHPKKNTFFVTGSFDRKIRMWDLLKKKFCIGYLLWIGYLLIFYTILHQQ